MDNTQVSGHPLIAFTYTSACVICGIVASIASNIELYVRVVAGVFAIASGFMAIRYYYYATKEKKQALKQMKL